MFEQTFWIGERSLQVRSELPDANEYWNAACRRLIAPVATDAACDAAAIAWDGVRAIASYEGRPVALNHVPGNPTDAAVRATAALFAESFRRMARHRAIYAAGVATERAAFALVGPSGIGKTTLAIELLRRGWRTYGDEFLLLERATGLVHPFPLAFMLREPALFAAESEITDSPAHPVSRVGDARVWHGFDVESAFGARAIASPQPLTHIVFLERASEIRTGAQHMRPSTAAFELLPHVFVERPQLEDIWEILDRLATIACYRLACSDAAAAADALMQLAEEVSCTSTPAI